MAADYIQDLKFPGEKVTVEIQLCSVCSIYCLFTSTSFSLIILLLTHSSVFSVDRLSV